MVLVVSSDLTVYIAASPRPVTWEDLLDMKIQIIRSIMMGQVSLPLETADGQALCTSAGVPIHAVYDTRNYKEELIYEHQGE